MPSPNIGAAVRRARDAIRRIRAMEREDIREVRALLAETRADLIASLARRGQGSAWSQTFAATLLREVDAATESMERSLGAVLLGTQREAATLAVENTLAVLKAQGIEPLGRGFGLISPGTLIVAQTDAVADMITGVTEEFRTATRRNLRRALAGGLSLSDFERRVGNTLPGPGPFGTVAKRAEVIVRNETADAFQIAGEASRKSLDSAGFVYRKRWVTARDARVRPSHLALDGVTVDAAEDFDVGGHSAAYPKDPRLPAEESINCRCVVIEEIDAEKSAGPALPSATFGGRSIAPVLSLT